MKLVHVGGDDDLVVGRAVDGPHHVPHGVAPEAVDVWLQCLADEAADPVLVAGDAAGLRQVYEQVVVESKLGRSGSGTASDISGVAVGTKLLISLPSRAAYAGRASRVAPGDRRGGGGTPAP
jgi:hypothetical protein